jgi:PAS domain S-box-containing protein
MNSDVSREIEMRVLLAAPTRRDGEVTSALLNKAGLACTVCEGLGQLAREVEAGAGAILLTEEAMTAPGIDDLLKSLADQPAWSDLAVVLLLRGGVLSPAATKVLRSLSNVTLLERPAPTRSVVSAVQATIRGRARQYQIRDQIESIRRAEATSSELRRQLEIAINASELGTFHCEIPMGRILWNEQCKRHFWLPPEAEIDFDLFYSILHPDDRERTRQAVEACVRDGEVYDIEYRTVSPRGEIQWIRASGRTTFNEQGAPVQFDGTTRDVTDRKRLEMENESRLLAARSLAAIVESSEDAIVSKSLDGMIQSWNAAAEKIFGYTAAQAVGRHISLIIPAERAHEEERIIAELKAGKSVEHFETVRVRNDGKAVQVSLTISPIKDESGQVIGASKIARDITEQKRAEAAFKESEKRRRLALDSAELGAWHVDPLTMTLTTDERFRTIFGVAGNELSYEQAVALIHPDDQKQVLDAVAAATRPENPEPYAVEYRVVHPDGSVHWVFAKGRANYHLDMSETLASFDGTVADITERKQLDENLQLMAANLADANHRKDEFLATLAHELRNPLAPIRNSLHLLQLSGELSPSLNPVREIMERQVDHMVRLIDDLLDVSRISSGKIELQKEAVELATIVSTAVEVSRPAIDAAGHQLALSLPAEPMILEADPVRLAQIVGNLLNNAAKYTRAGGQIWLTARGEGSEVVISIRDNGVGIPGDMLPRIFDMFAQVDRSLTRAQGGLGIGLTLAKTLTEMHGGRIEARSAGADQGSEFLVYLPLVQETQDRSGGTSSVRKIRRLHIAERQILVVDDTRAAGYVLGKLLETMGQKVEIATDAAAALESVRRVRPDMVISDIAMPDMDGYELARRLRQEPGMANVVLVALTGYGQDSDKHRSNEAGFNYHLVKPASLESLYDLLTSLPAASKEIV